MPPTGSSSSSRNAAGRCPPAEAARSLFALAHAPAGLARSLLDEVVSADARLVWTGAHVALAAAAADDLLLEAASFVVVDLETTGLSARTSEICEIGAVRIRGLAPAGVVRDVRPSRGVLPPEISRLTGIRDGRPARRSVPRRRRCAASSPSRATACSWRTTRASTWRSSTGPSSGSRRAASRRPCSTRSRSPGALLGRRRADARASPRSRASSARPWIRATERSPDAQATAEILVALIGLAQERGAATVADLQRLAAPRARRAHDKRSLAFGAPTRPGVYLFRGAGDQVLYVGRARDLRARLRSYFGSERQRPAVEAALAALERIEWRVLGSEVEAAVEELRLIRELRPPANARGLRPDRYAYLERRDDGIRVARNGPTPLGPIKSRRRAELRRPRARRARRRRSSTASPRVRRSRGSAPACASLAEAQRYEDAARLRDRLQALEAAIADLAELDRLRATGGLRPRPGGRAGVPDAPSSWPADGSRHAPRAAPRRRRRSRSRRASRRRAGLRRSLSFEPEDADELLSSPAFLRRPPPELSVLPLDGRESSPPAQGQSSSAAVA